MGRLIRAFPQVVFCCTIALAMTLTATGAEAVDTPPECRGDTNLDNYLVIDATVSDDNDAAGISGVGFGPGTNNLTLGGPSEGVSFTIPVSPLDPSVEASGTVVFTDLGAQTCAQPVQFFQDDPGMPTQRLCADPDVSLSLIGAKHPIGGVCIGGPTPDDPCATDLDCGGGTCGDVCRGGLDDGMTCLDGTDCPSACIGGTNDGLLCLDDLDCPSGFCGEARCSRRAAECTFHPATPGLEPLMPDGYVQWPFCPILSVRAPDLRSCDAGPNVGLPCQNDIDCFFPSGTCVTELADLELLETVVSERDVRLMLSGFDITTCSYTPFRDVTTLSEQFCTLPTAETQGVTQGIRDEGIGDLGGGGSSPAPPEMGLCPAGSRIGGGVKVTCAKFDAGFSPDCSTNSQVDFDGDGFPLCQSSAIWDCNDANPFVYPGAPELCNGLTDDCTGGGGDIDGDGFECDDCAPTDSTVWAIPIGAVTDLRFLGDKETLDWTGAPCGGASSPPDPPGLFYDTVRTLNDPTMASGACIFDPDTADTQATDSALLGGMDVFYYLIRPTDVCGEGPMGTDSAGAPRAVPSCP